MDRPEQILSIIVISILLLGIPITAKDATNVINISDSNASPAAIDIIQMLPNPNLETEPDAFVNGSSGEFDYSYAGQTMQLNWTHTQNTELDFHSDDDSNFPSYNDFVYFTQSFDWPYEELPEDAECNVTYGVTLSGGFDTEPTGMYMFKVYIWLIDSSGNWANVYYSNPPYITSLQSRRIDLNYFDILEGWGGMIEDGSGIQEDPEDTLTLGIGLAPTSDFVSSLGNGSVLVEVSSEFLYVVMQTEPDPATFLTPLYNETFASTISQVLPRFAGDATPLGDSLTAMTQDPDGNLYITGYTNTPYQWYQENHVITIRQFLIKYNPVLNRMWLVRNNNLTRGYAITYHDGNLYTSGMFYGFDPDYYNLMLTKWTTSGQKIWEKEWGGAGDQIGIALGVHNDGSIYVLVADHNIRSEPTYQNSSLMKFDSAGNVLWNKPLPLCTLFDVPGKMWVFESNILYSIQGTMLCMDLDGNVLWQEASYAAACDDNGTIYSAKPADGALALYQYDLNGNDILLNYYELEYPNGWLEWLIVHNIALTNNNELIVLIQGQMYDYSYHLLKFGLDGTLQQTWSIGNEWWPLPGGRSPLVEVTHTGLAYFSFVMMNWDVCIQGYAIGDYTLPPLGFTPLTLAVVGGGIAAIALIGIFVYKKKKR
ncbi:MAG: SBBP repeat-containing protein [Candidatus Thorarchaeota archaeon]